MDSILQDISPATMAQTIDANKIAYGRFLSSFPEGHFHADQGICWFETGIRLSLFNGVLQTRLEADQLAGVIERVLSHFRQRQLPFHWRVGPSSQPSDMQRHLAAHGISYDEDEPGMALDLSRLNETIRASTSVAVQQVTTAALLEQWVRVWGCGAPEAVIQQWLTLYSQLPIGQESPLHFYLGTLDNEPVATAALFFGAGVASIEHVVTLPQIRRQGIGAAMTLMAARAARSLGYRIAVLTASPMGISTYRRLGFQEYGTFTTYEWHPPGNNDPATPP